MFISKNQNQSPSAYSIDATPLPPSRYDLLWKGLPTAVWSFLRSFFFGGGGSFRGGVCVAFSENYAVLFVLWFNGIFAKCSFSREADDFQIFFFDVHDIKWILIYWIFYPK